MAEKITRSYTLREDTLKKIDEVSKEMGISKSSAIELMVKVGYSNVLRMVKEVGSNDVQ